MLLVLDSRPFEDLHHIVDDFNDDRVWVFAEWVGAAAAARCPCATLPGCGPIAPTAPTAPAGGQAVHAEAGCGVGAHVPRHAVQPD